MDTTTTAIPLLVNALGPENAPLALRVLQVVAATDLGEHRGPELLEEAGINSMMTGLLILARLSTAGFLTHRLGSYMSTPKGLATVRAALAA